MQCVQCLAQLKVNSDALLVGLANKIKQNEKYHSPVEMFDCFVAFAKLGYKELFLLTRENVAKISSLKGQKQFQYCVHLLWAMVVTDRKIAEEELLLGILQEGMSKYQRGLKQGLAQRQLVDVYNYLRLVEEVDVGVLEPAVVQKEKRVPDAIWGMIECEKVEHHLVAGHFKVDIYLPQRGVGVLVENYHLVNFNLRDRSGFAVVRDKIAERVGLSKVVRINHWEWMQRKEQDRAAFVKAHIC